MEAVHRLCFQRRATRLRTISGLEYDASKALDGWFIKITMHNLGSFELHISKAVWVTLIFLGDPEVIWSTSSTGTLLSSTWL